MRRILIKRTNETEPAYLLRSFNHASEQVNRCYQLQAQRIAESNRGAALFYQGQAAMWHRYMVEYRDCLNNDFFPGTDVRVDAIFPGNDRWTREVFNKIPIRPWLKLADSSAYGKMRYFPDDPFGPVKPISG